MELKGISNLNWVLPVRIAQLVFAIIVMGLTAAVIHKANKPVSDYSDYSDYYTGGAKGSDNYSDELEDYLEDYGYDYDFDDGLMSGKVKVRVKRDFGVSGEKSYDDLVYFMLFNSIWTIVVALPYLALVPVFFAHLSNIFVTVGVEAVTCIFWFAGFIGLAATLPEAQMCDFVPDYCRIVRMSQAATVFGAFEWVLFGATTFLAIRLLLRSRKEPKEDEPAPAPA